MANHLATKSQKRRRNFVFRPSSKATCHSWTELLDSPEATRYILNTLNLFYFQKLQLVVILLAGCFVLFVVCGGAELYLLSKSAHSDFGVSKWASNLVRFFVYFFAMSSLCIAIAMLSRDQFNKRNFCLMNPFELRCNFDAYACPENFADAFSFGGSVVVNSAVQCVFPVPHYFYISELFPGSNGFTPNNFVLIGGVDVRHGLPYKDMSRSNSVIRPEASWFPDFEHLDLSNLFITRQYLAKD